MRDSRAKTTRRPAAATENNRRTCPPSSPPFVQVCILFPSPSFHESMAQSNGIRFFRSPSVPPPTSRRGAIDLRVSDFLPLRSSVTSSAAFPPFRSHLEVKVAEGVSVTKEKFRARKGLRARAERDRKRRDLVGDTSRLANSANTFSSEFPRIMGPIFFYLSASFVKYRR